MASNIVNIVKALSDDTRLRVIHLIDQCGPDVCVCDMVAVLGLPQSTISRQLMRLRHNGVVVDSRDGMWMNYAINNEPDTVRDAFLNAMRMCWETDPILVADRKKFYELHAEQKIVRCKRSNQEKSRSVR